MITDTLTSLSKDEDRVMILLQTLGSKLLEHEMMAADESATKSVICEWFGILLRSEAYGKSDEMRFV